MPKVKDDNSISTARARWRADMARYDVYLEGKRFRRLRAVFHNEAIISIALFRYGQYLKQEASRLIYLIFIVPYSIIAKITALFLGVHIYPAARIGPGLYIAHSGGIWISPKVTVGANCNISQGVTIGVAGGDRDVGPVLGDRVWVGPNAVITGRARVGSGAVVGANSLVATTIPENAVAVGVPAKIISYAGSGKLIKLPEE